MCRRLARVPSINEEGDDSEHDNLGYVDALFCHDEYYSSNGRIRYEFGGDWCSVEQMIVETCIRGVMRGICK